MRTVSNNFLIAQNKSETFPVTYVSYKRRYWDTGTSKYIYEASWTRLERDQIVSIDSIIQNLDTETLSEFQISNVTIHLRNTINQWKEDNPNGYFASDLVSANGYEPYLMKFKITSGYMNVGSSDIRTGESSAGNEELVTMFTGLANSFTYESENGTVMIDIQGIERLLQNADASVIVNNIVDESLGTGNGTTIEYFTSGNGVGNILNVKVNSVTLVKGTDYDISDLNDYDNPAKIEFAQAPASGATITCSYSYWNTNQTLETIISDIVTEAGITSTSIENSTLGSIQNNVSRSSKKEFNLGTNTSCDISSYSGQIRIDYKDTNNILAIGLFSVDLSTEGWGILGTSANDTYWDAVSGQLEYHTGASGTSLYGTGLRHAISSCYFGQWQFSVKGITGTEGFDFAVFADEGLIQIKKLAGSDTINFITYSAGSGAKTYIVSSNGIHTYYDTYNIVKTVGGEIHIYENGIKVLTVEDNEKRRFYDVWLMFETQGAGLSKIYFDDIYCQASAIGFTHISDSFDTLSGLTAWGALTVSQESNESVFNFQTRTSTDNSSWDAWANLGVNNAIQSAVKRYIQVKINISLDPSDGSYNIEPLINYYNFQFSSDRVFVAMSNYSGLDCYRAVQEYAKLIPNFEWGFDSNEVFFYRERNDNLTPDVVFTQNTNLLSINTLYTDFENIYSIVRAEFGEFQIEVEDTAGTINSMIDIIGRKLFTIGSNVLINKDTNIAQAIAPAYLTRLKKRRKRLRIKTKLTLQLELSDTVSVTYIQQQGSTNEQFLNSLICNVIGTMHNTLDAYSEFELEEIA